MDSIYSSAYCSLAHPELETKMLGQAWNHIQSIRTEDYVCLLVFVCLGVIRRENFLEFSLITETLFFLISKEMYTFKGNIFK